MNEARLTHVGDDGAARMVDVGDKAVTERVARARARVLMSPAAAAAVKRGDGPKGEVLGVARVAGIAAAKQAGQLIPLAHTLELTFVDVGATVSEQEGVVELVAEARTRARTGVEMEAMTAAAVAALTVYDMVKGLERSIEISSVVLLDKSGGRHDYTRTEPAADGVPGSGCEAAQAESTARGGRGAPAPRVALITVSTSKAAGAGEDRSGARLAELARGLGAEIVAREIVADDREQIAARLRHWTSQGCELILTSGGTGVAPGDVTPEATAAVIERSIPGLGEAMRAASRAHTPYWALSRALAGTSGRTLIVNLPGRPASIDELAPELLAALPHALALLAGEHPH